MVTIATAWREYAYTEDKNPGRVDSEDGKQDHEGIGVFAMFGLSDQDANPVKWSGEGGLSGKGSIPGRDDDTWGAGYFHNDVQNFGIASRSSSGWEAYYDIEFTQALNLTLNAQFLKSGVSLIDDSTVLGLRLFVRF